MSTKWSCSSRYVFVRSFTQRGLFDEYLDALGHVVAHAVVIPLLVRLAAAFFIGRPDAQLVRPGHCLPRECPAPPGVFAERRLELSVGPGPAGVDADLHPDHA